MKHRIVVLGAGYAGAYVAGNLARRLSPADIEITVINAVEDFVQRQRLNQLAAGPGDRGSEAHRRLRGHGYSAARGPCHGHRP
ncbi:hypothetical protein LUW74_19785 [Actinomadura madurae]|uniref:hypothetical protein n=1 Tax=Actinomadura madurae TaxID=1993 RepID=UPI002027595C|nr:hypothetical protein [Actinomadura madurae]URN05336.1 hypothetical protein LUW74_19785 [Actinomadura madurae]